MTTLYDFGGDDDSTAYSDEEEEEEEDDVQARIRRGWSGGGDDDDTDEDESVEMYHSDYHKYDSYDEADDEEDADLQYSQSNIYAAASQPILQQQPYSNDQYEVDSYAPSTDASSQSDFRNQAPEDFSILSAIQNHPLAYKQNQQQPQPPRNPNDPFHSFVNQGGAGTTQNNNHPQQHHPANTNNNSTRSQRSTRSRGSRRSSGGVEEFEEETEYEEFEYSGEFEMDDDVYNEQQQQPQEQQQQQQDAAPPASEGEASPRPRNRRSSFHTSPEVYETPGVIYEDDEDDGDFDEEEGDHYEEVEVEYIHTGPYEMPAAGGNGEYLDDDDDDDESDEKKLQRRQDSFEDEHHNGNNSPRKAKRPFWARLFQVRSAQQQQQQPRSPPSDDERITTESYSSNPDEPGSTDSPSGGVGFFSWFGGSWSNNNHAGDDGTSPSPDDPPPPLPMMQQAPSEESPATEPVSPRRKILPALQGSLKKSFRRNQPEPVVVDRPEQPLSALERDSIATPDIDLGGVDDDDDEELGLTNALGTTTTTYVVEEETNWFQGKFLCFCLLGTAFLLGGSFVAAYMGTQLALEQDDKDSAPSSNDTATNVRDDNRSQPTAAPVPASPTAMPTLPPTVAPATTLAPTASPVSSFFAANHSIGCPDGNVPLELVIKLDAQPADVGVFLLEAASGGSPLWQFATGSFASFSQLLRENYFMVCISPGLLFELDITDASGDGLVSELLPGQPLYGQFAVFYQNQVVGTYHGDCNQPPPPNAGSALHACGAFCACQFVLGQDGTASGQCQDSCQDNGGAAAGDGA